MNTRAVTPYRRPSYFSQAMAGRSENRGTGILPVNSWAGSPCHALRRGLMGLLLYLICATAPADAGPPDGASVQERLNTTLVSIDLDGVMFSKVIDQLRAEHQLNIYVNEKALAAAGVGRDTRITLRLAQVPLATALELILRDAGGEKAALSYVVENDVVVISTGQESAERPITRIYDVIDLIDSGYASRRMMNTPLLALRLTGDEAQGAESAGGGSATQNPFQGGRGEDETKKVFERLEALIDLIKTTIRMEDWRDNGGKRNTIGRHGNRLIVLADLQVHQDIESLLALLRSRPPKVVGVRWTLIRVEEKRVAEFRAKAGPNWPRLSSEYAAALEQEFGGDGATLLQATTTGPSGKGQLVSSLRQRDYISAVQPVVDEAAIAHAPVIAQANSGVELIVLPLVAHDGQSLTLDVSLAFAAPPEIAEQRFATTSRSWSSDTQSSEIGVQLRTAEMHTVIASVRLNLGEAVVVGVPEADGALVHGSADQVFLALAPVVK